MSTTIHPTAILGENVTVGEGCEIGPYCIVEDNVTIGEGNRFMAHVYVGRYTAIGNQNTFFPFSTIGVIPQDLKFEEEETRAIIGDHNVFREHVTLHRGTGHGGGVTRFGSHNLMMVGSHVAHDCQVGDRTIMSHQSSLAGHVTVGDDAVVGAYSSVHQFCAVGNHAFIGGFSVVTKNALPYVKTVGNRASIYGINNIGLERKGFSREEIDDLKNAYRILFQKKLRLVEALDQLEADFPKNSHVQYMVKFIREAERGIVR